MDDNKKTQKAGKIEPAIGMTLKRLQVDEMADIDPYGETESYDGAANEGPSSGPSLSEPEYGREPEPSNATAAAATDVIPGNTRRKGAVGRSGARGDGKPGVLHLSARRKAELDLLLLCHRLDTGERVPAAEFVFRYMIRGLEAERPKVLDMYRRYEKKSR